MPEKVIETPYPLIDADPHFTRVVRYFRWTDYATWAGATAAAPAALYAWERSVAPDPIKAKALKIPPPRYGGQLKLGAFIGFVGGFLLAYQNSSFRFWGWRENKREEERDYAELSARAAAGLPLYGESDQPEWVQAAAHRNSAFSQLKFQAIPMFNFVNHPYHGTDPAKYGVKSQEPQESS
ncbi:hypothetical protein PLICRDRAFT_176958 [Plicaturopsis crispa FD-325 SS-3]|nr:hypothetical protein PLICRDRAFT_176958 [Plicaturopsis crispa FD-325 SS-3]